MTRRTLAAVLGLMCWSPAWGDETPAVVRSLAFSPDGKTLAAGFEVGEKGEVLLREVGKPGAKWRQAQAGPVRAVCFLPDGKTLAAAAGPSLLLMDAASGKTSGTLGKHDKAVMALALSADGKSLASGGEDGAVRLWDVARREEIRKLRQGAAVAALAFSPDGGRLLWSSGREAGVAEVKTGKSVFALSHDNFHISCVAYLSDAELMTGGYDGSARLHDAKGSRKALLEGMGGLRGLAYAPGTKALALWSDDSVGLIAFDRAADAGTKKQIAALIERLDDDDFDRREAAEAELITVGFRAEAALREAKSAKSAEVRIRARRALQTLLTKPGVRIEVPRARAAAFSPDGKVLAVGAVGGAIGLYDASSGKPLADAKE